MRCYDPRYRAARFNVRFFSSSRFELTISYGRDSRLQRLLKAEKQAENARLGSIVVVRTMLPLISGYHHHPVLISLSPRVTRSPGQGKARDTATVSAFLRFCDSIGRYAAKVRRTARASIASSRFIAAAILRSRLKSGSFIRIYEAFMTQCKSALLSNACLAWKHFRAACATFLARIKAD